MCAGKEFQLVEGADTEKARKEKLLVIPAGLVKRFVLEERCCSLLPHSSSAPGSSSDRPGSHTAAGPGARNVQAGLL